MKANSTGMRAKTTTIWMTLVITAGILLAVVLATAGCGESGISQSQYEQIQKGMTLDQVEALLGQPDRTHRTGPTQNPNIIWYYNKAEGDGLVRVSFLDGKMDQASPYDLSVNLDE